MADVKSLGSLDLTVHTQWRAVELDEPFPDYETTIESGCSGGGSKLMSEKVRSVTIPFDFFIYGSTSTVRETNRNLIIAELIAARDRTAGPKYYVRKVDGMAVADVWTILRFSLRRSLKKYDKRPFWIMPVDLTCNYGQDLPDNLDLTGLTVSSVLGGLGRAIIGSDGLPVSIAGL